MNRFSITATIITVLILSGCADAPGQADSKGIIEQSVPTSSASTQQTESQRIIEDSIPALQGIKSFKMETDVINLYISLSGQGTWKTEWNGIKTVDVAGKQMEMSVSIIPDISLEMYFANGLEYLNYTMVGLYRPPGNHWDKRALAENLWNAETQISYYVELLKSATESDLLGEEVVDGSNCYVISLTPSVQALVDWTISQAQPMGLQIGTINGGATPVVRADAYKNSSVKLWIEKDNNLPLKAEIDVDFVGFVGGGVILTTGSPTLNTNPVDSNFSALVTFSSYNQPVVVQIPLDALQAPLC